MVTSDESSRGQIILIGAIALAFIILGVVVVFNGVLYTETISSGSSSQSATTQEVTGFELEQSIGCLVHYHDAGDLPQLRSNVTALDDSYRNISSRSTPSVTNVSVADDNFDGDSLNVTITYDSTDFSYNQTRKIESVERNCPDEL